MAEDREGAAGALGHLGVRALLSDRRRLARRLARSGSDPALEALLGRIEDTLEERRAAIRARRSRPAHADAAAPPLPGLEPQPEDTALRARWRDLVGRRLPALAEARRWPVRADHCFARILLDNACGAPWRERLAPPAWRTAPAPVLRDAIRLGEAAAAGEEDLAALNRRSLALRGKRGPAVAEADRRDDPA